MYRRQLQRQQFQFTDQAPTSLRGRPPPTTLKVLILARTAVTFTRHPRTGTNKSSAPAGFRGHLANPPLRALVRGTWRG
jgi:hypothetical protein